MSEIYIDSDSSELTVKRGLYATRYFNSKGLIHRLDGPAVEWADGTKTWYVDDKEVDPQVLVAYWLERGRCCWYDEEANELRFGDV